MHRILVGGAFWILAVGATAFLSEWTSDSIVWGIGVDRGMLGGRQGCSVGPPDPGKPCPEESGNFDAQTTEQDCLQTTADCVACDPNDMPPVTRHDLCLEGEGYYNCVDPGGCNDRYVTSGTWSCGWSPDIGCSCPPHGGSAWTPQGKCDRDTCCACN